MLEDLKRTCLGLLIFAFIVATDQPAYGIPAFARMSSSNLPSLKLSQGDLSRLSNRTQVFSKWKVPSASKDGSTEKEIFLYSVPAVHRSRPERSKPEVVIFASVRWLETTPGVWSRAIRLVFSRCNCGVTRILTGK